MATMTISDILPNIQKEENVMAFREWELQDLMKKFQLTQQKHSAVLSEWLDMDYTINAEEKAVLKELRELLEVYSFHWNEIELEWNFISKVIDLVNYREKDYHFFLGRQLEAQFDSFKIRGRVDGVLASGKFKPEIPFFCFHEYKKEKGADNDPVAQLLSAMIAAQQLNNNQHPVYGCLVLDRNWFFLSLEHKSFCISNNYSSTHEDELEDIFRILKNLKVIVETKLLK